MLFRILLTTALYINTCQIFPLFSIKAQLI